jgi:hypothetical protein
MGKLLALSANVRLDRKVIARYKHSSLFGLFVSKKENSFATLTTGADPIKLLTTAICGFS